MRTNVCEHIGIDYPVFEAGVGASGGVVGNATVAAEVSEAGGLGQIGHPSAFLLDTEGEEYVIEQVEEAIHEAVDLTEEPLAINCRVAKNQPDAPAIIETILEQRAEYDDVRNQLRVLFTSAGAPDCFGYNDAIEESGMLHFHYAGTVDHAKKIEARGLDGIVASGFEGGGHVAREEEAVHTFVLVPAISEAVDIPVLAAGGCTDGASLAGALGLGAEGVYMGTRFVASEEHMTHATTKERVTEAGETDSMVTKGLSGPMRVLENQTAHEINELKGEEQTDYELEAIQRRNEGAEDGLHIAGMASGRIEEILSVREIVEQTVTEADEILADMCDLAP